MISGRLPDGLAIPVVFQLKKILHAFSERIKQFLGININKLFISDGFDTTVNIPEAPSPKSGKTESEGVEQLVSGDLFWRSAQIRDFSSFSHSVRQAVRSGGSKLDVVPLETGIFENFKNSFQRKHHLNRPETCSICQITRPRKYSCFGGFWGFATNKHARGPDLEVVPFDFPSGTDS